MVYNYYSDRFSGYDFRPHLPMRPIRLTLTYRPMEDYGLLDGDDVRVVEPPLAREEDLLSVHTPEYLEAVRPDWPNPSFGLRTKFQEIFYRDPKVLTVSIHE
jgi:acetoin utilization protein AcuC